MSMLAQTTLPKDRPHIVTTRLVAAPRELVWKVLTTPEHLAHFWGPDGFTNSYTSFDLRVGGEARFTMHGPDGKDWPNRFKFLTVDAPHLLRFDHDNGGEGPVDHRFVGEIELTEEGSKTRVELRVIEASIAQRDAIAVFAVEGGKQNLDRLAAYVAPLAAEKNLFVIERSFPVSQKRLFEACSQADDLKHWLAAPGHTVIKAQQDLRAGGTYHYGTASPQGQEMWGKITYKEITLYSRLVYVQSFADRDGNISVHPMAPDWPREMVTVMTFAVEGPQQTKLRIEWIYAGVSDAEAAMFHGAHDGMRGGWSGSLDVLEAHLARG